MTPPLIVRVAGLPAEVMDAFSQGRLLDALAERDRLRERLAESRRSLVDCLHGVIRTAAREERRFLLSVKRSCFNGGDLKVFQRDPRWPLLAGVASAWADRVFALEEAAARAEVRFEEMHRRALLRERESIVRLLEDRSFVRGVALASPDAARSLDRLDGRGPEGFGRREKRLCLTLLRYASRAALKLSPFSSLTRTGFAVAADDAPAGFLFPPGGAWKERSAVSLRRELLEQCSSLLLRCGRFAAGLPVALNETLAREDDGTCAFFRPGRWAFDDEGKAFRYHEPASVRAVLEGPLVPWLIAELRRGPRTYRDLVDQARDALEEDRDPIVEGVTGLIEIGFLSLVPPWSFSEPDLERKILASLDALPDEVGLRDFRDRLCDLTGLLEGYAEAASPARHLEDSRRRVEGLFQALASPAGVDPRIEFKAYDRTFEENVFLLPAAGASGIARLSGERMEDLLADLEPLARLIDLHNSVHDLLRTLAAFGARRWPGATDVGLLDFFGAAHPLFNEYLRYRAYVLARRAPLAPGFNPLGLESVKELNHWRERVETGLDGCFEDNCCEDIGPAQRLRPRALGALLDEVPAGEPRSCAFCAFLQPLDPDGGRWVLNAINEGFGRFGSRFTSGMDAGARAWWTASHGPLSFLELDGERAELVDLSCPGPRTINVHIPQTRRALGMPGEHSVFDRERLLRLSDLRVRLRGAELPPVLTDDAGRRILPVPFGGLAAGGRPTLLKFLAVFGPREIWRPLPTREPRVEGGVQVLDRHSLGRIVYARRKWMFEPRQLLSMLEGCGEAAAYAAVNRWRLGKDIPDQVFAREPILLKGGATYREKPQYIDFSSPSFLQVFRSVLTKGLGSLALEEALPAPERLPAHGCRWAAEIQLESFAFGRESFISRGVRGETTACLAGLTRKE